MAKIIAIANQKGGVGKTTTAVNTADALKHIGYRVLFLDMDPQHNSTDTYGAEIDGVNTIVDVLKKDCKISEAIQHTDLGDIVAGDRLLYQEESGFQAKTAREKLLLNSLKPVRDEYDFIIIDTPPNLGIYMINALTAADGCIVPIKAEQYAIDGLGLLIETVNDVVENVNPNLKIYGVVLTAFDTRNSLDKDIKDQLPTAGEMYGFNVLNPIRISQDVKKVQSVRGEGNRSLFDSYPNSKAAHDYVEMIKSVLEEINNG